MISLSTCVEGQKLRLRNEDIIEYKGPNLCNSNTYNHAAYRNGKRFTYTDSGSYFCSGQDMRDVIEILPLETTEPTSHPSVVWWESCPWITDRKPTEADGNAVGWVMTKIIDSSEVLTVFWVHVEAGQPWIHRQEWQPPALTDREQALQLLDDHQAGWMPTPREWHIIRKGLEAS
jgi:hypothetical protein